MISLSKVVSKYRVHGVFSTLAKSLTYFFKVIDGFVTISVSISMLFFISKHIFGIAHRRLMIGQPSHNAL